MLTRVHTRTHRVANRKRQEEAQADGRKQAEESLKGGSIVELDLDRVEERTVPK